MTVKMMKLTDIKFSAFSTGIYNPEPSEDLKDSIQKHGILVRPVVDQHGRLISGHRRVSDARDRGIEEIEVEVLTVKNDAEFESLVIAYNRQRRATWSQRLAEGKYYERTLAAEYKGLKAKPGAGELLKESASLWIRRRLEEIMGLSHDSWAKLKKIGELEPRLFAAMDKGDLSLAKAYEVVEEKHPEGFKERSRKSKSSKKAAPKPKPKYRYNRLPGGFDEEYALGYGLGRAVDLGRPVNEEGPSVEAMMRGLFAGLKREGPDVDLSPFQEKVAAWCPLLVVKKPTTP